MRKIGTEIRLRIVMDGPRLADVSAQVAKMQETINDRGRSKAAEELRTAFEIDSRATEREVTRITGPLGAALPSEKIVAYGHPERFAMVISRAMLDAEIPGALSFSWTEQQNLPKNLSGFGIVSAHGYELEWTDLRMADRLERSGRVDEFIRHAEANGINFLDIIEGLRPEAPMIEEAEGKDLDRSVLEYFLDNGYDFNAVIQIAGFEPPEASSEP